MVDYSKWDNLPSSPSSASSEEDTQRGDTLQHETDPGRPTIPSVAVTATSQNRGAVVFLHGSGDTGEGVREWLASVSRGKFEQVLGSELGLRLVFPTAPERPYALAGGTPSTVWFDRTGLYPSCPQDKGGILRSLRQLEHEVARIEQAGIPRRAVFIGGFSMGGGLALEALGDEAFVGRVAGIFCHSSFLSDDSSVFKASRVPRTSVYMSHGHVDGMVMASWGRSTAERLRRVQGLEATSFVEHEGLGHELDGHQVDQLLGWVSATVKKPGFGQEAVQRRGEGKGARCSVGSDDGTGAALSPAVGAGVAAPLAEAPCSVLYNIDDLGDCRSRVSFEVPPGSEELLQRSSICARGSFFQLESLGTPGRVETSFMSPKPEMTAAAIARRIEQRLADPQPPGMDEACCLS